MGGDGTTEPGAQYDIDWVGRYNSDKLSSLSVNKLSLYISHPRSPSKGKKTEKVAMIKAHIGQLAACCTIIWSVNNLSSPRYEMSNNK